MAPNLIIQEILLPTNTGFSKQKYCDISSETPGLGNNFSVEQLEKACWNGLLPELLPELVNLSPGDNKLYIWQIKNGEHFLCINMSAYPLEADREASVNPYLFMETSLKN
jgi:hypothetical protein